MPIEGLGSKELPLLVLNNTDNYRSDLHKVFHENLLPEVSRVLGKGKYCDPLPGYERAWRIFLGVNIEGTMHFVCHIAAGFSTCNAYSSGDLLIPNCPILLFGEPFHIETAAMDLIRGEFPPHHLENNVPVQMALSMTPKINTFNHVNPESFTNLLDETATELETSHFTIRKMVPKGTSAGSESLSFKAEDFPIEIWTHDSRAAVISTELECERNKPFPNSELLKLYEKACALEKKLSLAQKTQKDTAKTLKKNQDEVDKETRSLLKFQNDTRQIPVGIRMSGISSKNAKIDLLNEQGDLLRIQMLKQDAKVHVLSKEIAIFKTEHAADLPNSYREATFQIAFDAALANGTSIHKQYNSLTGRFETSNSTDIRFLNAVHTPYVRGLYHQAV